MNLKEKSIYLIEQQIWQILTDILDLIILNNFYDR